MKSNTLITKFVIALALACTAKLSASVEATNSLTFGTSDLYDSDPSHATAAAAQAAANRTALADFITHHANDTSSTLKTIYFETGGTYRFELGSSGQTPAFANIHNLLISGTSNVTVSWHSSGAPHSFMLFDADCDSVEIKDLTFTTTFAAASLPDGCHLKIGGTGFEVHDNTFTASPGFAVQFIGDATHEPSDVHFDTNRIVSTYADGIHVSSGHDLWFVGNVIMDTGDDGIAVLWDNQNKPDDIHILANVLDTISFRGIVVQGADHVWIVDNVITGTALTGIEVTPQGGPYNGNVPTGNFAIRANYAHINGNGIAGVGTVGQHTYLVGGDHSIIPNVSAIFCENAVNISIDLADGYYGRSIEPAYSLVGYPPSYTPAYFSASSTNYAVQMYHTLYGVIDHLANVSGSPSGATNAASPGSLSTPDAGNNLLLVNY